MSSEKAKPILATKYTNKIQVSDVIRVIEGAVMCSTPIWLSNDRNHKFIHPFNWKTLRTDLVHIVEIFTIAYGMSWKLRRTSWMRKGDEVKLY